MSAIATVRTRSALSATVRAWRREGLHIGLVPTMGALHAGHLSLVTLAKSKSDRVVASVFVNPAQFGPNEDFQAYPRNEARDAALLAEAGCDLLYAPAGDEIYPRGFSTTVTVSGLTDGMEGAARPGHFAGVATVVAKLLIQTSPNVAVFGEKDYQQLQVIRRLTADLDLPVDILAAPIVRDDDGLALSSRNAYLTPSQRVVAPALHTTLVRAAKAIAAGEPVENAEREARARVLAAGFEAVDYIETRSASDLARLGPSVLACPARLLAAARLGRTRLLDNVPV